MNKFETLFMEEGVISGLAVSQRGAGANMSVDVSIGQALVEFTNTLLTPNETYKIYGSTDAVTNLAVPTADATNPRIDRVIARMNVVLPNAAASNVFEIAYLTGTPAGSPAAPAEPSNCFTLATVAVAAGAVSVVNANVTDARTYATLDTAVLLDLARESKVTAIHNNSPFHATSTGLVNTYAISVTTNATAYAAGQRFSFKSHLANSGAATLNVNGWGAKAIKKADGTADLIGNDIASGQVATVIYDGTNFQLTSVPASIATQKNALLFAATGLSNQAGASSSADSDVTFSSSVGSATVGAGSLAVGDTIRVQGQYEDGNGANVPTYLKFYIGANAYTVFAGTPDPSGMTVTLVGTVESIGASGTIRFDAVGMGLTAFKFSTSASSTVTIDTTGSLAMKFLVKYPTSAANQWTRFRTLRIEKLSV